MNFLSWVKSKVFDKVQTANHLSAEWSVAEKPEEILAQACYVDLLRELKSLISITPHHFKELYLQPIYALASLVQQLPHPNYLDNPKNFLAIALERTITALKFRRGYMLPLGADTETCYREQDAWTYAIFTVALFQDCWLIQGAFQIETKLAYSAEILAWQPFLKLFMQPKTYYRFKVQPINERWKSTNAVFIKALLPEKALNWLSGYPQLFVSWWDSITAQNEINNPINDILQRINASMFNANDNLGEKIKVVSTKTKVVSTKTNEKIIKANTQEKAITEIKFEQENIQMRDENSMDLTMPMKKQSSTVPEQLLHCLKSELKQVKLKINQLDGFIHHVPEGIFLVMPDLLNWLTYHCAEFQNLDVSKVENQLLQDLTASSLFIKNIPQNDFLHRYFIGRWDERHVLTGLLLPYEILFNSVELPPVNEQLHLEPTI